MADKEKAKDAKKEPKKKAEAKSEKKVEVEAAAETKPAAKKKKKTAAPVRRRDKVCTISGCKGKYRAKGYCRRHYRKWRRGDYGVARYHVCGQMDCRRPQVQNRHGFCEEHYIQHYVKKTAVRAPVEEGAEAAPAKTA